MTAPLYVISLDRTPQRFEAFCAANTGLRFERVSAVDGLALDRERCIADGVIAAENAYTPAAIGCALSHIGLWRRCAGGAGPITIVEDDCVLRSDFHDAAEAAMAEHPDFDLIKWSWNYDWPVLIHFGPGAPSAVVQSDQVNTDIDMAAFRASTTPVTLFSLVSAAGTSCYTLSPKGARRLLALCLPIGDTPAPYVPNPPQTWRNSGLDVECCRHYADLNARLAMPPLAVATNRQDMSTIRGHLAKMHDISKANVAPA